MKFLPLITLLFLLTGCNDFEPFKGEKIKQYASTVIGYSSQWSGNSWSAQQALGQENVYPALLLNQYAWASLTADGQREFLVLGFAEAQSVKKIEIFETANPGAIDTVYLRNAATQKWVSVYARPARTDLEMSARIFSIHLIETPYFADAIRLAINSPAVPNWNQIDAVAITGQK